MGIRLYKVADLLELLLGVIATIAAVLGIIAFVKNNIEGNMIWFIVVPSIMFLICSLKICKIHRIATNRLFVFSEHFHKLTDAVRDEFFSLKKRFDKNELTTGFLLQTLEKTTQQSVDCLAHSLTLSTGKQVFATLKYFDNGSIQSSKLTQDMNVITLCRSSNQSKARTDRDEPSKIKDNTDFYDLAKNAKSHFATNDLTARSKQLQKINGEPYKNSNPLWGEYYNSTIVVPIRIKRKHVDPNFSEEGFDIVGFLCVDSKSKSAFRDSDMKAYINYVKAYADCLYKYFDRFLYYQGELLKKEEI